MRSLIITVSVVFGAIAILAVVALFVMPQRERDKKEAKAIEEVEKRTGDYDAKITAKSFDDKAGTAEFTVFSIVDATRRRCFYQVSCAKDCFVQSALVEGQTAPSTQPSEDCPMTPKAQPDKSPAYTPPSNKGPSCKKGCPCGNSCIDCSKKCNK